MPESLTHAAKLLKTADGLIITAGMGVVTRLSWKYRVLAALSRLSRGKIIVQSNRHPKLLVLSARKGLRLLTQAIQPTDLI